MEIKYYYKYDYITSAIVEDEENYNDERKERIEESINNALKAFKSEFLTHKISYTLQAEEGKGILTFTNLGPGLPVYKEIDKILGEIGATPSNHEVLDDFGHIETPATQTKAQDRTAPTETGV